MKEYDAHILNVAGFLVHVARLAESDSDEAEREKYERLYESVFRAWMALRRERIKTHGAEEDITWHSA
jgi:hypothetical protein